MPQSKDYTLVLDDSSSIVLDENQLPGGFDTLDPVIQDLVARKIVSDHITVLQEAERPATFADFAWPIAFLIVFALIILWVAKKIQKNPKTYDAVVKLDRDDTTP